MTNGFKLLLVATAVMLLAGCSVLLGKVNYHYIENGQVWFQSHWGKRLVIDADAETFQPLSGGFGKDANHVYFTDEFVNGAQPETFRVIDFHTGIDANFVFTGNDKCIECDRETFTKLPHNNYRDKYFVYYGQGNMRILKDADPKTFTVLNNWFSKDANYVFQNGAKIPGADANTFSLTSCGISEVSAEDKNRCYWYSEAVPCDCEPHSGDEFPFVGLQPPNKTAHFQLISQKKYQIESANGKEIRAKLNAFVPAGKIEINYSCTDESTEQKSYITTTYDIKNGRVYSVRDAENQMFACDSEIVPKTWFEGQNDFAQTSIKFISNENKEIWAVRTELPTSELKATIICRIVMKDRMIEDSIDVLFTPQKSHLYTAIVKRNEATGCDIELMDSTTNSLVQLL